MVKWRRKCRRKDVEIGDDYGENGGEKMVK
jgi:hypothetical protein